MKQLRGLPPPPEAERAVAELQARVRRSGEITGSLRYWVSVLIAAPPLVLLAYFVFLGLVSRLDDETPEQRLNTILTGALTLGLGGLTVAVTVAFVVAEVFLAVRRSRLRRMMAALPEAVAVEALSLEDRATTADTRRLARSLRQDLRSHAELTPAPTPEGRGSEVSVGGMPSRSAGAASRHPKEPSATGSVRTAT